jgi:large subunit ribosomal protein L21
MAHEKPTSSVYAIIESGGKQFKVRPDRRVRVPSLQGEVGERVTFDRVLFASGGDGSSVGAPTVTGATVTGEIVGHGRGTKVVVFKYKRRHRYRKKTGHRQGYTEVAILDIAAGEVGGAQRPEGAAPERQVGPYVCEDCGRGFATERGLHQHRAKAHVE